MFLVHDHSLGPGLSIKHPGDNHISPWYILCLIQGYVLYIPGPFVCSQCIILLVQGCVEDISGSTTYHPDHFLGPGLSHISLDHLHACSWYIIVLVQGCSKYISGPTIYHSGTSYATIDHRHKVVLRNEWSRKMNLLEQVSKYVKQYELVFSDF